MAKELQVFLSIPRFRKLLNLETLNVLFKSC